MRDKFWLWIFVFLGFNDSLSAQPLSFRYVGKDQGLNSLASWFCAIDHFGFIWVSSGDGLVRFNGKETTYYFQQSHPEMPADQIGFIHCDSRNRIWVCFDQGLVRIDEHRQFKRQVLPGGSSGIDVDFCVEDNEGNMYAFTSKGVFSSKDGEGPWHSQHWLDSLIAGRGIKEIRRFDLDKYLLIFPSSGVMMVNLKEKKQQVFVPIKGINCATRFDDKSILIGRNNRFELLYVSLETPSIHRVIDPPPFYSLNNIHEQIHYMVRGGDQKVYMTTTGAGLVTLDSTLATYQLYSHDPVDPSSIINNSLRYIIADSAGNLVITTLDGVNYCNVHNSTVEYVTYLKTEKGEIIDPRVISIAEDLDQRLWLCTKDNVFIHDHLKKTTIPIVIPSHVPLKSRFLAPMYVERDQYHNLWIALRYEGIAIFYPDGQFKKFIQGDAIPKFGNSISQSRILREGYDGYMYVGSEEGLFRISHADFALDTFADHPALSPLRKERIVDIYHGPTGMWVSSSPHGAAWHYSFKEKKLKRFNHSNGMPSNRIYGISGDEQGNVFVGSYNGLSIIMPNDSVRVLTKGQGLISPRIEANETADDGSVWLANNYTLLKYNPLNESIIRLGSRHGLTKINFAVMGSVKLSSGNLVFGANKGFVIVDPKKIDFEARTLKVFTFYHDPDGKEIVLPPGEKLSLDYTQQNIHFSFAVNDLIIADQVLYKYQLSKNAEGPWSNPSLNASVDFNLDPGTYTLNVQAYDGHSWFEIESPIPFQVKAPWWRQWWFVLLLSGMVIAVLWKYVNGRFQKVRKELMVSRQIAELEAKALRAQMNPHFVFNSLNAIQECIVTGKVEEAYTYLSKFSRLLRMVLEHSDMAEVTLQEELEVLGLYISLEKLRFKDDMKYIFEIDPDLDTEEIRIPPMLIQPHLENAIWHGLRNKEGEKLLTLTITEKDQRYLEVIVIDNGIGRAKAELLRQTRLGANQHKSKGKLLTGDRMELLRLKFPLSAMKITDLCDKEGSATGTKIELVIPILEKNSL